MNIASRGATMAVDWEQRIDFDRLRTDRLARTKAVLEASELGSLLLFDPNNLRYVTSTAIGTWERDKNIRFALVPRGGDPILWDFGSAAKHHQLYCPWLPESSWRAWVPPMRGAMADRDRDPRRARRDDPRRAARARARERPGRDGRAGHHDAARAPAPGDRDRRLAAGDARGAQAEDRGRARAARPRGRDRRCGLRGDLPAAAPRDQGERGRRGGDEGAVRPRLGARRGDQRDLRRPLHPASAHVRRPAAAPGRPVLLRHHPLVHGLPDVLLPHVQRQLRDAVADRRVQAVPRVARRRDRARAARRDDGQDRRGLADARRS